MQSKSINSIEKHAEKVGEVINQSSVFNKIMEFLEYKIIDFGYGVGDETHQIVFKVKYVLIVAFVLIFTSYILKWINRLLTKNMPVADKEKFKPVFSFTKWVIYFVVTLIAFDAVGINVTAIFAASAALLIGVGLALQTLFQDIISGAFILIDQTVRVGDIIEIENKVCRVEEINLRTTRGITLDNKMLIIPNHSFLANSLYNWTQNGSTTRESVSLGVAYGSDVKLVETLLMQAALSHPEVMKEPEPRVVFADFGEYSLNFRLTFSVDDSFHAQFPKSDIRFEIDKLFRENNITIPLPQREIHVIKQSI